MIAIIPVDLAKQMTVMGADVPQPSIEHTIVVCDLCAIEGWVGPKQREHYNPGVHPYVCYYCIFAVMGQSDAAMEVIMLDPNADEKPRRT